MPRRKLLNERFPNFKNIRPFTKDEKKIYESIIPNIEKKQFIKPGEKKILNVLYKAIFEVSAKWSNCGKCNVRTLENLKRVYEKSCEL
jgi:hypothetical protein